MQRYRQQAVNLILKKNNNTSSTGNISLEDLEEIFYKIYKLRNVTDAINDGVEEKNNKDWDVMKSIYYTFTVVTTIGIIRFYIDSNVSFTLAFHASSLAACV